MGYTPVSGGESTARRRSSPLVHLLLFLATFAMTAMAGAQWLYKDSLEVMNWVHGLTYATLIVLFLSAHEFGHYIAARIHGVDASLPYFIPVPPIGPFLPFGTMGALIRIRTPIPNRRALFDIGVAGPIAGFVVCLAVLIYGFMTLPTIDYLYTIHPEYVATGIPSSGMHFGDTLLFSFLRNVFANSSGFIPPMNEVYHYPFLCVGWFGLFVTSLNMLPFGQLDGGHVLYSLIGQRQHVVARLLWWLLFTYGILGLVTEVLAVLAEPSPEPYMVWMQTYIEPVFSVVIRAIPFDVSAGSNWLLWAFLIRFLIRIPHPPIADPEPLSLGRKVIGWTSIIILVSSFTPTIITFVP